MKLRGAAALALLGAGLGAQSAGAIVSHVPVYAVREVPVERLLKNLARGRSTLSPAEQARAIGRLHLLAYVRKTATLTIFYPSPTPEKRHPGAVVAERVLECDPKRYQGGRCVLYDEFYNSPMRPAELPVGASEAPISATDIHLMAAIEAYQKARALEPGNLRTRIALAYALSRAGREREALVELRFAAREALKYDGPGKDTSEGFDLVDALDVPELYLELEALAQTPEDHTVLDALRARRFWVDPPEIIETPILVPMGPGSAFEDLVDRHSGTTFDFTGRGLRFQGGWLTPRAAWLVWDPAAHGDIHSGFQLFGSETWVASWNNGYRPLAALDDNDDGRLTGHELDGLALWVDANGDGVSQPGEVTPIRRAGVVSLSYDFQAANSPDVLVSPDGVTFADGRTAPTYDWTLRSISLVPVRNDERTAP